jgi:hypothetical protein
MCGSIVGTVQLIAWVRVPPRLMALVAGDVAGAGAAPVAVVAAGLAGAGVAGAVWGAQDVIMA